MQDKNQCKVYFISGVSGSGKTSTLKHLKEKLPSNTYDVRDLDERGVPDGGGLDWLNRETRHWLDVARVNASQGRSTIICGFANPDLFKEVYRNDQDIPAQLILLNVSGKNLESRLHGRHATPESVKEIERASGVSLEQFIKDNIEFAPEFRKIFDQNKYPIIETDERTPSEVADQIIELIR